MATPRPNPVLLVFYQFGGDVARQVPGVAGACFRARTGHGLARGRRLVHCFSVGGSLVAAGAGVDRVGFVGESSLFRVVRGGECGPPTGTSRLSARVRIDGAPRGVRRRPRSGGRAVPGRLSPDAGMTGPVDPRSGWVPSVAVRGYLARQRDYSQARGWRGDSGEIPAGCVRPG